MLLIKYSASTKSIYHQDDLVTNFIVAKKMTILVHHCLFSMPTLHEGTIC